MKKKVVTDMSIAIEEIPRKCSNYMDRVGSLEEMPCSSVDLKE